ncbi:MAG: PepSY-associated TM helix domain-containing protein [Sphingomonas sp.]
MTKLQLRRAWFQVHKWIGLGLAILIIPLSLSGALLVWDQPLDRLLNPARYATTGTTQLPLDRYLTAARAALPLGTPIASVAFPDGAGPVIVQASTPGAAHRAGPPARTSVWLDPPTARLLAVADSRAGALRFIHMLHGNLLVPGVGRTIVGWIGVAMALSCLTGLWLWWPLIGKWSRGLRWRRHRNFDTNLHHLFGFWIALPLFVLSVTGAWIAFPMVFLPSRGEHGPPRERLRGDPVAAPDTLPHAVIDAAQKATHVPIRSLVWPVAGRDPAWVIVTSGATLTLDDRSGAITTAPSGPRGGATSLSGIMRRLHDGEGMGAVWQTIIFIGGILPSGLAVTGIVMWWRARSWRAQAAKRRFDRKTFD